MLVLSPAAPVLKTSAPTTSYRQVPDVSGLKTSSPATATWNPIAFYLQLRVGWPACHVPGARLPYINIGPSGLKSFLLL